MAFIHMKDVIGRCLDQLIPFCEQYGLEHIDCLGQICHFHPVTMLIKYVEIYSCNKGITHGTLLIQKSRIGTRLAVKPGTPFVYDHTDIFIRIILIHDRPMTLDQLFHEQGFI